MPLTKVTGGEIDNNSTINVSSYSVTGVATFSGGPILIGSGTSTGTATQRLQVTGGAYVSGNLGIGTTNPTTKLDVFVNGGEGLPSVVTGERMRVISNDIVGRSGYLSIISGSSAYSGVFFGDKDSADVGKIRYYHADNSLQFHVNGLSNPSIHLDSSGNLLVGTSTPTGTASQPLQVTGGAYVSGNVGVGTTLPSSGTLEIAKQQNFIWNGLSLKNTGTSGITLGSLMQLHAYNGSSIAALGGVLVSGSTWNYGTYLPNQFSIVSTGSGGVAIAASIAPIIFRNGNADVDNSPERARVSAGGTFHVGTTNQWPGSTSNTIAIFNGTILCGNTSGFTTLNTGTSTDTAILCGGDIEFGRDGVSGTQRRGKIRGLGDSTSGPYSGGMAFDYLFYNGSNYVYGEGLRISANGNVGVGNSSPAGKIHVTSTGSRAALFGTATTFTPLYSVYLDGQSNVALEVSANAPAANGGAGLVLSNSQTASGCQLGAISFAASGTSGGEKRGALITSILESSSATSVTSNLMFFTTSAGSIVERARFNSTGAFVLAGGTTTANGIGIAFPATQSASTNANTLDDYEEGNWSSTISSPLALSLYNFISGYYTKVGRLVHIVGEITYTPTASGTELGMVIDAPFAMAGSEGVYAGSGSVYWSHARGPGLIIDNTSGNSTQLYILLQAVNNTSSSSGTLRFGLTYTAT